MTNTDNTTAPSPRPLTLGSERDLIDAGARVVEFVRQHKLGTNLDPERIATVQIGPGDPDEAPLLASDLLLLVEAAMR